MGLDHGIRKDMPRPAELADWDRATEDEKDAYFDAQDAWRSGSEIIQWRKENHIHAWFVKHVQGGVDECQDAAVSKVKLGEFLDTCKTIVSSTTLVSGQVYAGQTMSAATGGEWQSIWKDGLLLSEESIKIASELMPTQGGFFFGGTQYNEWYDKSLVDALEVLTPVYEAMNDQDVVIYWSSW